MRGYPWSLARERNRGPSCRGPILCEYPDSLLCVCDAYRTSHIAACANAPHGVRRYGGVSFHALSALRGGVFDAGARASRGERTLISHESEGKIRAEARGQNATRPRHI